MFLIIPLLIYLIILGGVFIGLLSTRQRSLGYLFLVLLCLPVVPFALRWFNSPSQPKKADIIGHYEIDRSRWPGKNADWQHKIYTLEITERQAIIRDTRTQTVWKYRIEWSEIYDYRWGFADYTKRHHMIGNGPTLYRERFGHYYVFQSPLYGDVFFKKE